MRKLVVIILLLLLSGCTHLINTKTEKEPDNRNKIAGVSPGTCGNNEYAIKFNYPEHWGNLEYLSKKKGYCVLKPQNTAIKTVLYHMSTGLIAFIEQGTEYDSADKSKNKQETLKILHSDGKIQTIYTVSEEFVKLNGAINNIGFSPYGNYICIDMSGYEGHKSYIFDIKNNINILEGRNDINYSNYSDSVLWSSDDLILIIASNEDFFISGGEGGIFISDDGIPRNLNKVRGLHKFDGFIKIKQKYLMEDNNIIFAISFHENDYFELVEEKKYKYNLKTKVLSHIEKD